MSATVTVGLGWASASGSLGYGRTTGETHWVTEQTAITAAGQLAIVTGEHTQLNGALLNSDTGKLKLDTQTLGYADIAGLDKEHSYYLNVGGSYGTGGTQDNSQTGKGEPGQNNWSVQGYNATTDRQQAVRATVGAGEIVVRGDAPGEDSTAGLNRDPSKAYEVTRDEVHRTDVYVTSSAIDAITHYEETGRRWRDGLTNYGDAQQKQISDGVTTIVNQYRSMALTVDQLPPGLRAKLGDDQALSVAKGLVAAGAATEVMNGLPQRGLDALVDLATLGQQLASCQGTCPSKATIGVMPISTADGLELPATSITLGQGQAFLGAVVTLADSLPGEDVAKALLLAQAAMGPAKFLVNTLVQQAIAQTVGEKIDDVKHELSILLASKLTGVPVDDVRTSDSEGRKAYADDPTAEVINGSIDVVGARYLIDSITQVATGVAGKAAGRVVAVGGGAKATGGAAGKVDDLASTGTPVRPTPQKSEIDVGADLGTGARPQVSYKNGQEVPYGTSGSVRPDWCIGNVCSVEVKNYNIANNQSGLISNVSKQVLQRAENLPQGMQQQVVIDIRGQAVTPVQRAQIVRGIVDRSNGAISSSSIRFKAE
ncbi:hypothetical protein [Pseudomonas sp. NPDC007930]|uniref:hypothetical protein n=1 Tax=Pseudomonas sp. NPDC007930 TaxID=3364417 RepID=UPI0036E93CDA